MASQNIFNRQLCLEHDEKLVSYLSVLRDIEMRTKQIQPVERSLAELQDLRCQAKVGSQRFPSSRPTFLEEVETIMEEKTCSTHHDLKKKKKIEKV